MSKPWSTVWITGASSGIGLELAKRLETRARYIAISARSVDKLADVAARHASLAAHPVDVTKAEAVKQCVTSIEEASGVPDLVVLNAGVWKMMDAARKFEVDAMRQSVDVNYMGVVNAIAAVLPGMLARGNGHIAIVASVAGYRGLPRAAAYGPTKAALISLAESLRCDLAPRGITISVINPGFVDTPMTKGNPFPMPGLMPAHEAAERIVKGLEQRQWEISFPKRLVWPLKLLRILPDVVYFALIGFARQGPRDK